EGRGSGCWLALVLPTRLVCLVVPLIHLLLLPGARRHTGGAQLQQEAFWFFSTVSACVFYAYVRAPSTAVLLRPSDLLLYRFQQIRPSPTPDSRLVVFFASQSV
ncbi:unnamed protein product, partial [Ectocarpus sp. 12 AP-2014]